MKVNLHWCGFRWIFYPLCNSDGSLQRCFTETPLWPCDHSEAAWAENYLPTTHRSLQEAPPLWCETGVSGIPRSAERKRTEAGVYCFTQNRVSHRFFLFFPLVIFLSGTLPLSHSPILPLFLIYLFFPISNFDDFRFFLFSFPSAYSIISLLLVYFCLSLLSWYILSFFLITLYFFPLLSFLYFSFVIFSFLFLHLQL